MFIIKNRKIFVTISAVLVSLSIISVIIFGLNLGIDFKGGALTEVAFVETSPDQMEVKEAIPFEALIQPIGVEEEYTVGYSIKTKDLTNEERNTIISSLGNDVIEKSFTSIGPSVGTELARKSILSFILVALGIILFIAFSFRKVSKPVSSWKYGLIAVTTLIHDIAIPVGGFVVFSHFIGIEIDTLFVVAILTILGLSVSDTIVVFDRIRENIRISSSNISFSEIVGNSIKQVYTRSIATSFAIILVLLALVFFGPSSIKNFALMLTAGMFFGTYSSLFLASPLLVMVKKAQDKRKK